MSRLATKVDPPAPTSRSPFWRLARLIAGWTLVALGILGLFLPVVQGVALILAGLALLAPDVPFARRWLNWLKNRVGRLRRNRGQSTR